jgi:hypothetical protein
MSDDRLSHEEFLEELAAFDKVLRTPAESARPPMQPPDLGLDEPVNLVPSSRDTEALRALEAPPPLPQQSRVGVRWVGALVVGLLAGGLLGWWLALNPIVRTPLTEPAARARSTTAPAATAPAVAARDAAPNVSAPVVASPPAPASREVASAIEAARPATARAPSERRVNPPSLSPPSSTTIKKDATTIKKDASARATPPASVPSATAGGAGIPSGAIVSSPPIAPPLPAAPLAVRPSMPPAAPPVAPLPRAAAGALAAAAAADEAAIEAALRQYEDAYERLDAKAAASVWPTVDQRALSRAFAGLASQELVFRGCEVVVSASTAIASCRGTTEYVQKVGNARPHVEPREWTLTLNKTQGEWRIETVDGRR